MEEQRTLASIEMDLDRATARADVDSALVAIDELIASWETHTGLDELTARRARLVLEIERRKAVRRLGWASRLVFWRVA